MIEKARLIVTRAGGFADYLQACRIPVDDIELVGSGVAADWN